MPYILPSFYICKQIRSYRIWCTGVPSVPGYLGYDKDYVAFGRNVFHPDGEEPFAFNYNDNVYQLMTEDHLLMFDGNKTVGLFNYVRDPLMKTDLKADATETERLKRMGEKLKAVIQQYNNRMIGDELSMAEKL